MDISARAISLAVRPQWAIGVTRVRMRRKDRSSISFLVLSQTSAGKGQLALKITRLESWSPRMFDHEQERSKQCGRACWRGRWRGGVGNPFLVPLEPHL